MYRTINIAYRSIVILTLSCFISLEFLLLKTHQELLSANNTLNLLQTNKIVKDLNSNLSHGTLTDHLAKLSASTFADARIHAVRSAAHKIIALESLSLEEKSLNFCLALSAISDAITLNPNRGSYLVTWATLKQLLGSVNCRLPGTKGNYLKITETALAKEPFNSQVLFPAARIYLRDNLKPQAHNIIHRILRYRNNFSVQDQQLILTEITSTKNLSAIIPIKLESIVYWSNQIRLKSPNSFQTLRSALGNLQLLGIDSFMDQLSNSSKASESIYLIKALYNVAADDRVRRKLDRFFSENSENGLQDFDQEYLSLRSKMKEVVCLKGLVHDDYRPLSSNLSNWNIHLPVKIGLEPFSVGLFLPPSETAPRVIELLNFPINSVYLDEVKVFLSEDNITWQELNGFGIKKLLTPQEDNFVTVIYLPNVTSLYWKLHLRNSSSQEELLINLIDQIKVYG